MKLYLVRHPETERNASGELSGWERSEYSKKGERQFEKILGYLSNIHLPIYSSDLKRVKKLAEKLAKTRNVGITIDKRLREINCKETLPHDSYETDKELGNRVREFLDDKPEDSIIISHAGVVRWITTILCGKDKGNTINNFERDTIFKIETVKNRNKLSKIKV